ncbi:MAG: methyltransferase domain-containing protein [Candidatus Aenigmatarchaeota archaeon]|nr:methyltransferase domain-containing protein [Candidatus Aenigmarchaeota archaeon]
MNYLFVLGKNPVLSKAEIYHYFKNRKINFEFIKEFENILEVKTDRNIGNIIDELGGTIKIAVPLNLDELHNYEKIKIGLSVYPKSNSEYKNVKKHILNDLKKQKIKAIFSSPKFHGHTDLKHFEVLKILKKNGVEIISFDSKFYKTVQVHNPFAFKKRDVERPRQRPIYSIPPRLARIMINLVALPGQKLLDPFCGIGTILQEALISSMDVYGLDKNKKCLDDAKINLNWLGFEKFNLIEGDATKLSNYLNRDSIDVIVTEPYLGQPLKSNPSIHQAEKILNDVTKLFESFLSEAHKVMKDRAKICMITPLFVVKEGKTARINMEDLCKKTKFKIIELLPNHKSIVDAEERHKTKREIWVLEK